MSTNYSSVIGSGVTPHLAHSQPHSITPGTYPVPDQRSSLRVRQGEGVVVLNPENWSVSIGLKQQAVNVGGTATVLPTTPLENRRALAIHNNGPGILFIGLSDVTTANGFPLAVGEKIGVDSQGTPNVQVYGVSSSTSDVRILEYA